MCTLFNLAPVLIVSPCFCLPDSRDVGAKGKNWKLSFNFSGRRRTKKYILNSLRDIASGTMGCSEQRMNSCVGAVSQNTIFSFFFFSLQLPHLMKAPSHMSISRFWDMLTGVRRYEQAGDLNHAVLRMTSTHHTVR